MPSLKFAESLLAFICSITLGMEHLTAELKSKTNVFCNYQNRIFKSLSSSTFIESFTNAIAYPACVLVVLCLSCLVGFIDKPCFIISIIIFQILLTSKTESVLVRLEALTPELRYFSLIKVFFLLSFFFAFNNVDTI